jgi:DNA-binding transcriptional MocR family regulator
MNDRFFIRLLIVFIIVNGTFMLLKPRLLDAAMHYNVLLVGNGVLALITALSYYLSRKGLATANNNAFIRMVYASTFSKLMLCLVGVAVYVLVNQSRISRATLFTLMFLYVVYTVLETWGLYKMLKKKT